eukprot:1151742-Pelagomonas_calceolata.AAC.1
MKLSTVPHLSLIEMLQGIGACMHLLLIKGSKQLGLGVNTTGRRLFNKRETATCPQVSRRAPVNSDGQASSQPF